MIPCCLIALLSPHQGQGETHTYIRQLICRDESIVPYSTLFRFEGATRGFVCLFLVEKKNMLSQLFTRNNKASNTDLSPFNVRNRYIWWAAFKSVIKPFRIAAYQNNPFLRCYFTRCLHSHLHITRRIWILSRALYRLTHNKCVCIFCRLLTKFLTCV